VIVVTVELHSARTGKRTTLGRAVIMNDGTGGAGPRGNYDAVFFRRGQNRALREVRVEGFPRRQLLVWDLLLRALRAGFGERNP
jgi:hypothetical protein